MEGWVLNWAAKESIYFVSFIFVGIKFSFIFIELQSRSTALLGEDCVTKCIFVIHLGLDFVCVCLCVFVAWREIWRVVRRIAWGPRGCPREVEFEPLRDEH